MTIRHTAEPAIVTQWILDFVTSRKPSQAQASNGNGHVPHTDPTAIEKRAICYLEPCPPAISGSNGHDTAIVTVLKVVHGFALTEEQAMRVLGEWNNRCVPPWSEKELRHKVTDALKAPGPRGRLLEPEAETIDIDLGWIGRMGANGASNGATPRGAAVEEFQPFPTEAMPEAVRDFVVACAKSIGCDQSMLAVPALAVLAGAIGNSRAIEIKQGWREPSVVWAVIIAESGAMKSPAFEAMLRTMHRAQERMIAEFQQRTDVFEASSEHIKGVKLPPIVCERIIVRDITIEKLGAILLDNPRGLLLARDELAGWLKSFSEYKKAGGADTQNWLELWNAATLLVDRKHSFPPTIFVPRAAVSVVGGVQPGTFRRAIGDEHKENGLLARLLVAMPPYRVGRWSDEIVSESVQEGFDRLIESLLHLSPATNDGKLSPVIIELNPEARAAFIKFHDSWADEIERAEPDLRATYSKLKGMTARFALLFHLAGHAADGLGHEFIAVKTVESAITVTRWFAREARRVYAALGESPADRSRRQLLAKLTMIAAKGVEITARELQRSSRQYRTADDAKTALDSLAAAGIGHWEQPPVGVKGGQPAARFILHKDSDHE